MRILLDHGANVNARVEDSGQLHRPTQQRLIAVKINLDIDPIAPVTALESAVWQDDAAKVGLLLQYGADPEAEILLNDEDNTTKSSIHSADVVEVDSERAIAISDDDIHIGHTFDGRLPPIMIVEQWERTTKAIFKMTVFHFAVSRGVEDVVRLFLQHGAFKKLLSVAPSEPTALHLATLMSSSKVVKMLLDQTVNVNPKDPWGMTPLYLAARCGYDRTVNELLEHGADTNAKNTHGNTPLHVAILREHDLVAKDLLDYGADIHLEDNRGISPQQLAEMKGVNLRIQ